MKYPSIQFCGHASLFSEETPYRLKTFPWYKQKEIYQETFNILDEELCDNSYLLTSRKTTVTYSSIFDVAQVSDLTLH